MRCRCVSRRHSTRSFCRQNIWPAKSDLSLGYGSSRIPSEMNTRMSACSSLKLTTSTSSTSSILSLTICREMLVTIIEETMLAMAPFICLNKFHTSFDMHNLHPSFGEMNFFCGLISIERVTTFSLL